MTNTLKFNAYFLSTLLSWSPAAMSAAPDAQSASFHLDAPPARVFPFFTAEGERAWAPGWVPDMLSGAVERGSVFRTHAHGRDTVWIVIDYRAETHRASYARLVDGMNMGLVDVACDADGAGTKVTVRYTLTPLSEEGAAAASEFLAPARYAAFIREWQQAIGGLLTADAAR